ncbi:hypothetical protein [Thiomicrorhabdus cannonii]|uniref:hypothetical protein n=1 Tax=Thiomicrorhabdus cannonii TaxID=2748011 RepID=UPI0015B8C449|nr:hypothetical protein [Thiomicrorhabdus cannonii]
MRLGVLWGVLLAAVLAGSGCEKVTNSAKNLQSDWIGLDRTVEIYSCQTGKLLKVYKGDIRLNPEDNYGASLLVNGKKLHTNLCYIIAEKGVKEEPIAQPPVDLNR